MTENESIETLQYLLGYENAVDKGELDTPNNLNSQEKEALRMILEEIQQYRTIGTVERLLQLQHDYWYLNEMCKEYSAIGTVEELKTAMLYVSLAKIHGTVGRAIDACAEYESIGTIEEFRALKEKNEPKKPLFSTVNRETAYHCGSCKKFVGFYDTRIYEYCHNCGTKIDWS